MPNSHWTSAGFTEQGARRRINQDAALERDDVGLWLVTDGVGGHADGEVASSAIRDAFLDFNVPMVLDDAVADATSLLARLNRDFLALRKSPEPEHIIAATVTLLMIQGDSAAILWAGDTRLFRIRNGVVQQLTRDHLERASDGGPLTITRAVGVADELHVDRLITYVSPGDRFMIATDGLYRSVTPSVIAEAFNCVLMPCDVSQRLRAEISHTNDDDATCIVLANHA